MTERDLQRWSREVAEDPGAPSFVRLARAYRRQGRRDAAREVVLAGLAANPEHVDAHSLLALLFVEGGEHQQAGDEWETVLRLDPGNFEASRGLGFLALERSDLEAARRHLDAAARTRPDDPAVSQAREVLDRREGAMATETPAADGETGGGPPAPSSTAAAPEPAGAGTGDPARLFASLAVDSPFRGALVVDDQGLVLAGALGGADDQGEVLGALLNTAVGEARRTAEVLRLGDWSDMLLETAEGTLHVGALDGGAVVVVVAERGAPTGWVVRIADRARDLAVRFMEGA